MTTRRRILRRQSVPAVDADQERRQAQLCGKLAKEQASLKRWKSKLKRAFSTVGRLQASVTRLEKRLALQLS